MKEKILNYLKKKIELFYVLKDNEGIKPYKKYNTDAAYDLYVVEKIVIPPLYTTKLKVSCAIKIPESYVGLLLPRSSYRLKGLVCHSVVDANYTGTLDPIVTYITSPESDPLIIEKGERVIQLLILSIPDTYLTYIENFGLDLSTRGENGFGSTGKF